MSQVSRATLLKHFPNLTPCLICNDPRFQQNHRMIDAFRDLHKAGESIRSIWLEYEKRIPYAVIRTVVTVPLADLNFLRRNPKQRDP